MPTRETSFVPCLQDANWRDGHGEHHRGLPAGDKHMRQFTKNVYVIEKNPKAQVDTALEPEEGAKKLLPRSDIAVFAGATIVNHSFETLLSLCSSAREIVFFGPTCRMIPEPLFDHGVTLMGGLKVYDGDRVLLVVSEGGSGNHFYESCATKTTVVREILLLEAINFLSRKERLALK